MFFDLLSPLLPLLALEIRSLSLAPQGPAGSLGPPLAPLGSRPVFGEARGGGGWALGCNGPVPSPCPGGRTRQPGLFSPSPRSREGLGLRWGRVCLQPSLLLQANLSGLSARSCFPQHSIYFPRRHSQFLIFCRVLKPGLPQPLANDFPGDEIRSKRGSLHYYQEWAKCTIRFQAVS